jgi:hypothetical protein
MTEKDKASAKPQGSKVENPKRSPPGSEDQRTHTSSSSRSVGTGDVRGKEQKGVSQDGTKNSEWRKTGEGKWKPKTPALTDAVRNPVSPDDGKNIPVAGRYNSDNKIYMAAPSPQPPRIPSEKEEFTGKRSYSFSARSNSSNGSRTGRIKTLEATIMNLEEVVEDMSANQKEVERGHAAALLEQREEFNTQSGEQRRFYDARMLRLEQQLERMQMENNLKTNPYHLQGSEEVDGGKRGEKGRMVGQEKKRHDRRSGSDRESSSPSDQTARTDNNSDPSDYSDDSSIPASGASSRRRREREKRARSRREERRRKSEEKEARKAEESKARKAKESEARKAKEDAQKAAQVKAERPVTAESKAAEPATETSPPVGKGSTAEPATETSPPAIEKGSTSEPHKTGPTPSLSIHSQLQWSKVPKTIAENIDILAGPDNLQTWRDQWADRIEEFDWIDRKWFELAGDGKTVETGAPAGETPEQKQQRLAVAKALLLTYDRRNEKLQRYVNSAVKTSPRSVYTSLVGCFKEEETTTYNSITTLLANIAMDTVGADILTYNRVVLALLTKRESLSGKKPDQEHECKTYLSALLKNFDPIVFDIRKAQATSGVFNLEAIMKEVEDYAKVDQAKRKLADYASTDKNKLERKLISGIKEYTGVVTTKVNQLATNTASIRQQATGSQHPLKAKGCWHWWSRGECKFDDKCHKADTHTPEYKSKGKKASSGASTSVPRKSSGASTKLSAAERFKDHTCQGCGQMGHTKNYPDCPIKKQATTSTFAAELKKVTQEMLVENKKQMEESKKELKEILQTTVKQFATQLASENPDPSNMGGLFSGC